MKQTSDPTVDLDAMEAALLTELDAEEPNLSVLADAANALFNAMRDVNLDTTTFAVALEDVLADGEVNSSALASIATAGQEAVDAAERARGRAFLRHHGRSKRRSVRWR
jgi:endo-alpha-1,4-polygalactosaminidase (GH114 family)